MGTVEDDDCEHADGEAWDSLSDLPDGDRSRPVWLQPGTALTERSGLLSLAVEGSAQGLNQPRQDRAAGDPPDNLKQARVAPSVDRAEVSSKREGKGGGRPQVGSSRDNVPAAHRRGPDGAHSGAAATAHFAGPEATHESLGVQGMTVGKTQDGGRKLSAGRQRDRNGVVQRMPDLGEGKWQRSPHAAPLGASSRDMVLPLCFACVEPARVSPEEGATSPAASLTAQTPGAVVRESRLNPPSPPPPRCYFPDAAPLRRGRCVSRGTR